MTRRLVKIAKELNVGTSTIVDYLISTGFPIENKPTAQVTDEMYDKLLLQFSNSLAEKTKADQLIIGGRTQQEEEPKSRFSTPPVSPKVVAKESIPAPKKTEDSEITRVTPEIPQLKVVGKIDLTEKKPEPKVEKIDTPKVVEKVSEVEEKPEVIEPAKEQPVVEPEVQEEILRAKTPQLKGLKIMGKIDTKKFEEKKPTPKAKEPEVKTQRSESSADHKKRKRTRKVVPTNRSVKFDSNKSDKKTSSRKEEVKEISKKEIEEKIKATMARISGGSKNKRQKIRRDSREVKREKQDARENIDEPTEIQVTEFISVSELASLLNTPVSEVITTCMNLGVIVSINQRLDAEIIELLANEFGHDVKFIDAEDQDDSDDIVEDDPADLRPRAPIVTIMGHVDHGKTSFLDYVRSASVAEGEAGGITQHIGAYEMVVKDKKITFLDTPGHEAFTAMRARGAKVTDVVVIIVAADDRIMPQTKEAISHAQAAGVPIIFAINKIDKDGAKPEKIKEELAALNFLVEDWGGKYQSQDISAKTGENIDLLLDKILLEAEVLELSANPNRPAIGAILEASLDKGRGYVTKVLVQTGTLNIGDPMVAGEFSGKVKAMFNEKGKRVKKAGPATPVLVLGLSGAPQAGEKIKVVESDQEARQLAVKRQQITREQSNRANKRISLDEIGRRLALGTFKELNLIVKGDVDGSVEALSDALIKLSIEKVQVNVIHKAVGQIAESDILLASASEAIIVGFQVRPSSSARQLGEKEGVQIKLYSIIYEAIEEIKMAIEGMLEPTKEEKIVTQVEVREVYKISKIGTIAGCFVQEGTITRNTKIRVIRDGIVVYPTKEGVVGEISSLKRFKDDVKEVKNGFECGLTIKNFNDIQEGDIVEGYDIVEIRQKL